MVNYYVYILKSVKNHSYYIGYAKNLGNRLKQHREGLVKATRYKRPYDLVYYEVYQNGTEARQREYQIKKKKSRRYIDYLIENYRSNGGVAQPVEQLPFKQ
ncbi:MAG: GIY-YIG nuclease family protein [Planctomycetota bacterium]